MATFRDLRRYVEHDGWTEEPSLARGRRRTGDHRRYFRDLADGTRLRTKVSHDEGADIGYDLFGRILRDQLRVTERRFWDVVRGRAEGAAGPEPVVESIPGWLVARLRFTLGLSDADVARMTPEEARIAWLDHQSRVDKEP